MSPRRNWDYPNPSLASECVLPPPPGTKGRVAHSPADKGLGDFHNDDWRKILALCLLCGVNNLSFDVTLFLQISNISMTLAWILLAMNLPFT